MRRSREEKSFRNLEMMDNFVLCCLCSYFCNLSDTRDSRNSDGVIFYAFLKAHKMESAAYMLEHTEESVIEIASKHGYENASKFASAFKSAKGLSPVKYRSVCKRRNISDTASI